MRQAQRFWPESLMTLTREELPFSSREREWSADQILTNAGILEKLDRHGDVFDDLSAAIAHARYHVERAGVIGEHDRN